MSNACYYPLTAYRGSVSKVTGKRSVVFNSRDAKVFASELPLPCGRCIGCKLERSRQWAIRCVHESELYDDNCFLTLTYDDDHCPKDGSVDVRTFQLFMKRLRKAYPDSRIRFFHCGEYGEKFSRPHYHAIIFNFDFSDKFRIEDTRTGFPQYVSDSLTKLWGLGRCTIGDVTFESAAYVARYITKKVTGDIAVDHYNGRKPEYITMSRRPGIGSDWFKKFKGDVYPSDNVVVRGTRMRPPKYYDSLLEEEFPSEFSAVKSKRIDGVVHYTSLIDRLAGKADFVKNSTPDRLSVREAVKRAKIKSLIRPMEGQNED